MLIKQAEVGGFVLTESLHPGGDDLPWHTHDGATLCYVLRGGFKENSRGESLRCTPSTLKFMPAGERHCNHFDTGDVRGLLVEVGPERMRFLEPYAPLLEQRRHFRCGLAAGLALRLYHEFRSTDDAAALAIEGLMLELVALTSRADSVATAAPPGWLRIVTEYLEGGFTGHVSLSTAAAVAGVHPVTLARAFRRYFKCTVGEHVRRLRLDAAAASLSQTNRPIAEIAHATGFADQAHLSNAFRRHTGTTPKRFREAFRR